MIKIKNDQNKKMIKIKHDQNGCQAAFMKFYQTQRKTKPKSNLNAGIDKVLLECLNTVSPQ